MDILFFKLMLSIYTTRICLIPEVKVLNSAGILVDTPAGNSDTLGNNSLYWLTLSNSHFLTLRIKHILGIY